MLTKGCKDQVRVDGWEVEHIMYQWEVSVFSVANDLYLFPAEVDDRFDVFLNGRSLGSDFWGRGSQCVWDGLAIC